MKNKILSIIAVATLMTSATSCIREIDPQTSYATVDQVGNAPGAFNNAVDAITATLTVKLPNCLAGPRLPSQVRLAEQSNCLPRS